ncbi:MAG: insulinase family protein [Rickettsiales bacterium]|nr:insulinase family protein [Rickettsiales bacterium]
MKVSKSTLDNKITIYTDHNPSVESVTIHIGFGVGSIHETKKENGISHFLEHMIFKGTKKRNAETIAKDFEKIGGYFNAFTSRDKTMYYCKSLKEDFKTALEILSDIVTNSQFAQEEADKERHVILQELANSIDTPDDIIHDYFQEQAFPNQPFGRSILGLKENISSFSHDDLTNYFNQYYNGENMVISVSGNITHEKVVQECQKHFASLSNLSKQKLSKPKYKGGKKDYDREIEQMQILYGYESVPFTHNDFYPLQIFNYILGEGMSSRLFQTIREKQGLAYSIYSYNSCLKEAGIFGIHTSIEPKNKNKALKLIDEVIFNTAKSISNDDIKKANKSFRSNLLMNLESSVARSRRIASSHINKGRFVDNDELLKNYSNVTSNDIERSVENLFKSNLTLVTLGKQ